jgi:uncharacterized protein YkwD
MRSPARRLVTVLATIGLMVVTSRPLRAAESSAPPAVAAATASTVLELTNLERSRAGLAPLRENERLTYAAQLQSEQMGAASRMDHVLRESRYPNPVDRLAAADYVWQAYAENVAMGQRSAAEVVTAWMNSPAHRANILNPRYTELGIGYAVDGAGRPYYAQVFGQPAAPRSALASR